MQEVALPGTGSDAGAFLQAAVALANDRCDGTLSCSIFIPPPARPLVLCESIGGPIKLSAKNIGEQIIGRVKPVALRSTGARHLTPPLLDSHLRQASVLQGSTPAYSFALRLHFPGLFYNQNFRVQRSRVKRWASSQHQGPLYTRPGRGVALTPLCMAPLESAPAVCRRCARRSRRRWTRRSRGCATAACA